MRSFFCFLCLFLMSCDKRIYTIKNNYTDNIIAGSVVLSPSQCVEFFDFPLIGDFPIKFRYKDREFFSDKSYPRGHYLVSEKAEVLKQDKACKIDVIKKVSDTSDSTESTESTDSTEPDEPENNIVPSPTEPDEPENNVNYP